MRTFTLLALATLASCSHEAAPKSAPPAPAPSATRGEAPAKPAQETPTPTPPAAAANDPAPAMPPPDVKVLKVGAQGISSIALDGVDFEWTDDLPERKDGAGSGGTNRTSMIIHGWSIRVVDGHAEIGGKDFGAVAKGGKVLLAPDGVRVNGELRGKLP